jgi:hypothetical protein
MFKFNFTNPESNSETDILIDDPPSSSIVDQVPCGVLDINDIVIPNLDDILNDARNFKKIFLDDNEYIEYFQLNEHNEELLKRLNQSLNEINKTSDIVKGIYEGGLKAWECSFDLAKYIYSSARSIPNTSRTLNILELGCGHALPTLALLKTNASTFVHSIYLQDFNVECLKIQTFINIRKNVTDIHKFEIKFVYGSWDQLLKNKLLPVNNFNLIFSSETIYNPSYYRNLLDIFMSTLNNTDKENCIFLAAKSYYFGCGGNLLEFTELAKSTGYNLCCSGNLLRTAQNSASDLDSFKDQHLPTISREIIKIENSLQKT